MTKWQFVEDQLLSNSVGAAFQHANIYQGIAGRDAGMRGLLRKELKRLLRKYATQYEKLVDDEQHNQNVKEIADSLTATFGKFEFEVLRSNRFRIGIVQKALNLYLKYLWCLDKIPTPPHCPFDRQIINGELKLPHLWTVIDSLEEYQALLDAAKKEIARTGHMSLSDWELDIWSPDPE